MFTHHFLVLSRQYIYMFRNCIWIIQCTAASRSLKGNNTFTIGGLLQETLVAQKGHSCTLGGLWPPKSCFFLTEKGLKIHQNGNSDCTKMIWDAFGRWHPPFKCISYNICMIWNFNGITDKIPQVINVFPSYRMPGFLCIYGQNIIFCYLLAPQT